MKNITRNRSTRSFLAACGTLTVCGTLALLSLSSVSNAAIDDSLMRTVRYPDLDITKPAGAKVLYRRIKAAAEQVCSGQTSLDLAIRARNRACVGQAVDTAVRHVDAPALSALHPAAALQLARR